MDPFIGEIRIFTGNFAPTGWFLCQGQLLPISAYQALFAIIGTFYGGNGTSNFQLPNLQGRFPIGAGMSPSSQVYNLGQIGGVEQIVLTINNLPAHTHLATSPTHNHTVSVPAHTHPFSVPCDATSYGTNPAPTLPNPSGNYLSNTSGIDNNITGGGGQLAGQSGLFKAGPVTGSMGAGTTGSSTGTNGNSGDTAALVTVQTTGNGLPIIPTPLYLAINYIIAYNGIFPSRG